MRRPALYSSAQRALAEPVDSAASSTPPDTTAATPDAAAPRHHPIWRAPRALWACIALLVAALLVTGTLATRSPQRKLTQDDIDAAVLRTLSSNVLPSPASKAYGAIIPSVVRVTGFVKDKAGKEEVEQGVGSGVVIVDKGIILTNLHVVSGADTIKVTFSDSARSPSSARGTNRGWMPSA